MYTNTVIESLQISATFKVFCKKKKILHSSSFCAMNLLTLLSSLLLAVASIYYV